MATQALYQQIADRLRKELWRFKRGEAFFSDRDVARQQQVSYLTARRAVMCLVDEGLLERIERKGTFVKETNAPEPIKSAVNPVAQTIDVYRFLNYMPGSSIVDLGHYYAGMYEVCNRHIRNKGADLVFSSLLTVHDVRMLPRVIRERGEKAVIISSVIGESICRELTSIPDLYIVAIDCDYTHLGIDSITWNFHAIGRQAAQRFLDAGHRRLAFIGKTISESISEYFPELLSSNQWPNAAILYAGFESGVKEWCEAHADTADEVSLSYCSGREAEVEHAFADSELPTAVFCFFGEHVPIISQQLDPAVDNAFVAWSAPSSAHEQPYALEVLVGDRDAGMLAEAAMQSLDLRLLSPDAPVRNHILLPYATNA